MSTSKETCPSSCSTCATGDPADQVRGRSVETTTVVRVRWRSSDRVPPGHDPSGPDDAHPVRERLRLRQDVAGEQHGPAPGALLADAALEGRLHDRRARGRLVQQEQLDVGGQGGDQGHLLPVPLGVAAGPLGRVEVEALEQVVASPVADPAAEPGEEVDHLAAGQVRPQRDLAGHVGQPLVQRRRLAPGVAAEQVTWPRSARSRPSRIRSSWTCPTRSAEEAVHLPGPDLEVQAVEGDRRTEGLDQTRDRDRGSCLHCRTSGGRAVRIHAPSSCFTGSIAKYRTNSPATTHISPWISAILPRTTLIRT